MSSGSLYVGTDVQELNDSNFRGGKLGNKSGYLMVYAPWCPHCVAKVDIWTFLGTQFNRQKIDGGLTGIYTINADDPKSQATVRTLGVEGFPTFYKITNGQCQQIEMPGPFSVHSFIQVHCGAGDKCQKDMMKLCGLRPDLCPKLRPE